MDCYYSLEDYPQAVHYARLARDSADRPVGSEDRPHAILLQSLILMSAADAEIMEAYNTARQALPEKADFPLIYGTYAWNQGYFATACTAYTEGVRLHEQYYREGDFSGILAPTAYVRLGEAAALRENIEDALRLGKQAVHVNPHFAPLLGTFIHVVERSGADDVSVIEMLNGLYDVSDAKLLAAVLAGTSFRFAALYYDRRATVKFSERRRFLLAGDVCSAAVSLIEDMERTAAVAAASGMNFAPAEQGALALLLPNSCKEASAAPEAARMLRRIGRLARGME